MLTLTLTPVMLTPSLTLTLSLPIRHDYTIGTLDVLQACDTCADMDMTYHGLGGSPKLLYKP